MSEASMTKRSVGIAVVGAGKIGRHRARLAAGHAGVSFLAIVDEDAAAAEKLATEVGADLWATDTDAVVNRPDVGAVVVATPERSHCEPVIAALRAGKRTLVEKPIALTLKDADRMIACAIDSDTELLVGYSMRYAQRYAVAHQQIAEGKIGDLVGGLARTYDTAAIGEAILRRSPTATPVMDILTYLVDVIGWYHPFQPVEVVARSSGSILRKKGHDVDDLTVALLTFSDGAVFELATSYSLPAGYPINGMATRLELLGTEGVLMVTEDHGDQVMYSEQGHTNEYVDQHLQLTYLGSRTSGEWVGDTMFGRVADETRAWLDLLTVGGPCHIATAAQARQTLQITLAIDEAARTRRTITWEA